MISTDCKTELEKGRVEGQRGGRGREKERWLKRERGRERERGGRRGGEEDRKIDR